MNSPVDKGPMDRGMFDPSAAADSTTHAMAMADPAKVCIAGAGAMGTALAVRLALGGHTVSVLARGRTLAAIRADGMTLTDREGTHKVTVIADDKPSFGIQEVLFLCAKSQDLAGLAEQVGPLIGPDTLIVPVVNGIPWWYFERLEGRHLGRNVMAVDPDGRLKTLLPADRVIGIVAYITAERLAPGIAQSANPLRVFIGEIDHSVTDRVRWLEAVLTAGGIGVTVCDKIRDQMWTKVIANLTSNPLSVVSGGTLGDIYGNPVLAPITRQMLDEALLTAAAHGARVDLDPTAFFAMAAGMGAVRTSMLQDFDKGLPLELAAIGDAVIEMAAMQGLNMPFTRNILALARYRSETGRAVAAGQS